ncbi:MAG: type IV secretory system conjugative DNA transfer family protein, partial [Alphaproteobacteria bacterium]|nr:type IV secretory system conjugative DNA transfer family protein [Alphaproteobacteria bacterium]
TPWSETSKKQKHSVYTGIGLSVLCAVYCLIVRRIVVVNGQSRFFDCLVYTVKVIYGGSFDGVDETAFAVGFSGIILLLLVIGWGAFAFLSAEEAPYGEARFATVSDIKKMGLLDEENSSGIIVGKSGQRLLSPNCLRHGIALAPTRSGKTAGFVIPSALSFKGSLVIVDPKGELEKLLAKPLKKAGKTVYTIDWSDENSKDSWNPLSLKVFPSVFTSFGEAERQAERIAAMLVGQKGQTEDHWETNAKKHIAALILFSVYLGELSELRLDPRYPQTIKDYNDFHEPHLSKVYHFIAKDVDVAKLLTGDEEALLSAKQNLEELITYAAHVHAPARILNDLSAWRNAPDNEAGSHMTTFLSKLQIWRSQAVEGATRNCSFEWQDLRDSLCAVFIKFPQRDAQSLGVLTALFFETFFGWALDIPRKPLECPIAILADEFGSLPKINLMTDFLSKGAGMGAVIWIIVQDFAQIKKTYDDKGFDTIKTNCSYLLVYAQNNFNTQKELSQMTGKMTQQRTGESQNSRGEKSYSFNKDGADLIAVSDWGTIPFGRHILLCQGFITRPVYCETPLYFKEKLFTEKLNA